MRKVVQGRNRCEERKERKQKKRKELAPREM